LIFRNLLFRCECKRPPARVREIGLNDQHELVVRWWCVACKRHVYAVKSLSDCWRDCPGGPSSGQDRSEAKAVFASDAQFLHSLGIRLPEEGDS